MPKTSRRPATASTATGPNNRAHPGAPSIIAHERKLDVLEHQITYLVTLLSLQAQAIADEDTDTLDYVRGQLVDWHWVAT